MSENTTYDFRSFHNFIKDIPQIEKCDYNSCVFENGDIVSIIEMNDTVDGNCIYTFDYYDNSIGETWVTDDYLISQSFIEVVLYYDFDYDIDEYGTVLAYAIECNYDFPIVLIPLNCGLFDWWKCVYYAITETC